MKKQFVQAISVAVGAGMASIASGCMLPVATGTPQAATTVGRGRFGLALAQEGPVLNAVASDTSTIKSAGAFAATGTATVSLGVGDNTDIEISGDVAMYFGIFPLPTGGSAGIRQHLISSQGVDVAIAARVGGAAASAESEDGNGNTTTNDVSAMYVSLSAVAQGHLGVFRPLISANIMPMQITRGDTYDGLSTSATIGLMFQLGSIQLGPYATGTVFRSDVFSSDFFPSGGLMLSYRPDRYAPTAAAPTLYVPTPAPPPQPYAAPPAQPYAPPPAQPYAPPPVYMPPPTDPAAPPPVSMPAPTPAQP